MVTAGGDLIARFSPLYVLALQAQQTVALVRSLTALFAATIAFGQFDIKKVLAYSTISQLGFMVAAMGMGAFVAGMFHLITHAFFKALLFLSSGSVIQGMERGEHHVAHDSKLKKQVRGVEQDGHFDPQDMRNMGGLRSRMKITFWVYLIGALALAGIPPLAGFWSKDEILAEATQLNQTAYWLLTITAFLTAFYMGRQVLMVFFGQPRTVVGEHAEESPPIMTVPLMVLAFLTIAGSTLNLPGLPALTTWLGHSIETAGHTAEGAVEGAASALGGFNLFVASISTGLALVAIGLAWYLYSRRYQELQKLPTAKRPDDPLRPILGPILPPGE